MSATSLAAVIVHGVTDLSLIGAGTAIVFRFADRLQITKAPAQAERGPAVAESSRAVPVMTGSHAALYAEFARLRGEGKSVAEARKLAGVTETTSRRYEARRLAALDGGGA